MISWLGQLYTKNKSREAGPTHASLFNLISFQSMTPGCQKQQISQTIVLL